MEEKSANTIEKYARDVKVFAAYLNGNVVSKELVIEYKQKLIADGYAVSSINSMLAAVNSLFDYLGWIDCKVKAIKTQRQIYCPENKELSRAEYLRLVETAERNHNHRLNMILQTIGGTGIRISELHFITVEAVKSGTVEVACKGKNRVIFIVKKLKKKLLRYAAERHIKAGAIFITKSGKPVNRTNVWREMKALCMQAHVNPDKVFPHNLRHLFARTFYKLEKDIAKLADILGHSSINTTRIYIISTGYEHLKRMENMRLVV
ncbi:tyrosine-type recombinase/integrase [Ruminococcus sp.]|uniref:tyrosine-type recombinase/integrase n=1 Tax=Ruminococcus sp. TaxID=41978 RepID=UPI002E76DCDD|nr:tyrosine-type recombinase/integrase [Ruminococcus sp.]MEE1262099.1 tyrosine-type recombinase/integrase [Ruminococcus sp.]